ncbi:hypothetical protein SESBI_13387 [Sesbania bispinosa]|nr:hypothetical protein SESBI_13387 [Sesbania bispinosa]
MSSLKLRQLKDPYQRSTKKAKTKEDKVEDTVMEIHDGAVSEDVEVDPTDSPRDLSYREKLLKPMPTAKINSSNSSNDEEEFPENKWYNDSEEAPNGPFDPCAKIDIPKEEFEEWCQPWRGSLILNLMGKKITFCFLETRIACMWKLMKGTIQHKLWHHPIWIRRKMHMALNIGPGTEEMEFLLPDVGLGDPSPSRNV